MDDEIIHSWCFHDVECFDSTPSTAIIILDKDLDSFSSLRSQQSAPPAPWCCALVATGVVRHHEGDNDITMNVIKQQEGGFPSIHQYEDAQ